MLSVNYGLKSNYTAITTKDADALYFCTDTLELFKGQSSFTQAARIVSEMPTAKAQGVLYVLPSGEIKVFDGTNVVTVALPKTTSISSASTDSELATGKAVYDAIDALDIGDYAPLNSPTFTGTVTVPELAGTEGDAVAANKGYVDDEIAGLNISSYAPLNSPALTGTPTAPTVSDYNDDSTKIATTAFTHDVVDAALASIAGALHFKGVVSTVADLPASGNTEGDVYQVTTNPQGTDAEYVWTVNAGTQAGEWVELGAVIDLSAYLTSADAALTYAPLASPTFTGTVTVPELVGTEGDAVAANKGYVDDEIEALNISSYAPLASPTFTGTVTVPELAGTEGDAVAANKGYVDDEIAAAIDALDINDYAPLNSPAFTGTPTAPTVSDATDDSTAIATTAFVQDVVAAHASDYDAAGSASAAQSAAQNYADGLLAWVAF